MLAEAECTVSMQLFGSLRFVRADFFGRVGGGLVCKHTRTRGQGHEMESSQEVWYVLALVSSPIREGWGGCL